MLFCPGDNFAIPYDSDLSSDDVLPTLGGHLYVHLPSVLLVGGGHVDIPSPVLEPMNFGLLMLYNCVEPVDMVMGLFKIVTA